MLTLHSIMSTGSIYFNISLLWFVYICCQNPALIIEISQNDAGYFLLKTFQLYVVSVLCKLYN